MTDPTTSPPENSVGLDAFQAKLDAAKSIFSTLAPFDAKARGEIVGMVSSSMGIGAGEPRRASGAQAENDQEEDNRPRAATNGSAPQFDTFAELADAAKPKTQAEYALVAAYWLQVCQNQPSFEAYRANTELKHFGQPASNITASLDSLISQDPKLVLQLRKSGKSKQARKTYKLTTAGTKAVEKMIGE